MLAELRNTPLSVDEAVAHVSHAGAGAVSIFLGVVRSNNEGRDVERLEYQAYDGMARAELARIVGEIEARWPGVRAAAIHRTGSLAVGELAVVCVASAPHRGEAMAASRALIEGIKARVPIWKREHGPGGAVWIGWVDARCAGEHEHDGHGGHSRPDPH